MQNEHIDLTEAAKICPGRPHPSAVWRWCRRGIKSRSGNRVCLRHIRAGGKIYVKRDWLDEFFTAVADADAEHFAPDPATTQSRTRSHRQRQRAVERAERDYAQAGI